VLENATEAHKEIAEARIHQKNTPCIIMWFEILKNLLTVAIYLSRHKNC